MFFVNVIFLGRKWCWLLHPFIYKNFKWQFACKYNAFCTENSLKRSKESSKECKIKRWESKQSLWLFLRENKFPRFSISDSMTYSRSTGFPVLLGARRTAVCGKWTELSIRCDVYNKHNTSTKDHSKRSDLFCIHCKKHRIECSFDKKSFFISSLSSWNFSCFQRSTKVIQFVKQVTPKAVLVFLEIWLAEIEFAETTNCWRWWSNVSSRIFQNGGRMVFLIHLTF